MPCTDSRDDDCREETRRRLDLATRLLCEVMKSGAVRRPSADLAEWWAGHRELDAMGVFRVTIDGHMFEVAPGAALDFGGGPNPPTFTCVLLRPIEPILSVANLRRKFVARIEMASGASYCMPEAGHSKPPEINDRGLHIIISDKNLVQL